MSKTQRLAIVTGANRGIGLETVRQLANQGIKVILASRDVAAGESAWKKRKAPGEVRFHSLDITDSASVSKLVAFVEREYGRLDILVNNAGILLDKEAKGVDVDLDVVQRTLETNLFGAWRMIQSFLPLLRKSGHGRVVNVSSQMGQLDSMAGGYPGYRVSKTALNAMTAVLADEVRGSGILINACCPGWVRTDMGGANAERSVEQGADTPVWLAILPDDGPTGKFFQDRKPIAW